MRATLSAARPLKQLGGLLRASRVSPPRAMATSAEKPKHTVIQVTVIADLVCPWCFVGKRRLEKAMASFADKADFEVRWLPFQLTPDAPREGTNKLQFYNEKFGPDRVAQIIPRMEQVFAEIGAKYSMGGLTGNTMDGHRLLTWSEQFGPAAQNALAEEFFKAYHSEERYIGDRAVLLDCVAKAGLDAAAAALVLDDPQALAAETRARMQRGRGVGGVPFFIVNERYKLSGAQPSEAFEELFEQLLAAQ